MIGANVDPSHMFWQQMDPLAVVRALGPAVYHVHLKDTQLVPDRWRSRACWTQRPFEDPAPSGVGVPDHRPRPRPGVVGVVRRSAGEAGYEDVLSIENEDERQPAAEGVEEAAAFMLPILRGIGAGAPT